MLGKTHLAVGTAVTMAVLKPGTLPELLIGTGAAAVGAVISDIDVETSGSGRAADRIIGISAAAVALVVGLEYFWKVGVWDILRSNSSWMRIIIGSLAFIGVCAFGKMQPHRSFMHSFLALGILSVIMGTILPLAVPYFAAAFLSHLATDIFNFKKVQLFYPLQGGVCLRMFHASGLVNGILFAAGTVAAAAEIGLRVWNIIR